jgi:lysozyme
MSQLIRLLNLHEGRSRFAYLCTAGKITAGVGRNLDKDGGLGLSEQEIDYLLQNDIDRISGELHKAFRWFGSLNAPRRAAMIDLCFNLGLTRLMSFRKALAAMAEQDYQRAADEFMASRWSQQVGQRALRVTGMIRSGEWPDDLPGN